jgi:hypothetical protein
MDYVPQDRYQQVVQLIANYQQVRDILEQVCEINRELLRRREAL